MRLLTLNGFVVTWPAPCARPNLNPLVGSVELEYTPEEAQQLILASVAPLGEDYQAVVTRAFSDRWIDLLPSEGKRSGAYMQGGAYDVHPYMLINYSGKYTDIPAGVERAIYEIRTGGRAGAERLIVFSEHLPTLKLIEDCLEDTGREKKGEEYVRARLTSMKEFFELAKRGGGFLEYLWPKPGNGNAPKIGYATFIPGTDYWLGTGVYTDASQTYLSSLREELKDITESRSYYMLFTVGAIFVALTLLSLYIIQGIIRSLRSLIGSLQDIDLILDIPVKLTVELGRTKMTIKELLRLSQGSVVALDGLAGEPLDILINGYLIAQGEVVVVADKFGVRITDIITPSERMRRLSR